MPEVSMPALTLIPVLREDFISQKDIDEIHTYLWERHPDLILSVAEYEFENYGPNYRERIGIILDFLKTLDPGEIPLPKTNPGRLDVMYELSRRIRHANNMPEWPIHGRPLAEKYDGYIPEPPSLPIQENILYKKFPEQRITQEMTDRILSAVYKENPRLFYDFTEAIRHAMIVYWDVDKALREVFIKCANPEDNMNTNRAYSIMGELALRLKSYCDIDYEKSMKIYIDRCMPKEERQGLKFRLMKLFGFIKA